MSETTATEITDPYASSAMTKQARREWLSRLNIGDIVKIKTVRMGQKDRVSRVIECSDMEIMTSCGSIFWRELGANKWSFYTSLEQPTRQEELACRLAHHDWDNQSYELLERVWAAVKAPELSAEALEVIPDA